MKQSSIKKITWAGLLTAIAVLGSFISFPVIGSKCAPLQHMVNVICAVTLGTGYAVLTAFSASLLRNLLGLGSLLAFPGSLFGALISGILYKMTKKIPAAIVGEILGTGIVGGLVAYPVSIFLMGNAAGTIAFYAYVVPFLISTGVGAILAGVCLTVMKSFFRKEA